MLVFARSVLAVLCFLGFGVGGFLIGVLLFPLAALFGGKASKVRLLRASWIFFEFVMKSLGLIKVRRVNVNPDQRGRVIVANHPTLIDIVLLIASYKNSVCVVKEALARNFFLRPIISQMFINLGSGGREVVDESVEAIKRGYNVVIFPEGTRSDGSNLKIHTGAARIALRADCEILPVKISCKPQILGKTQKWYWCADRTVELALEQLPPIKAKKKSALNDFRLSRSLTSEISSVLNLRDKNRNSL